MGCLSRKNKIFVIVRNAYKYKNFNQTDVTYNKNRE